MPSRVITLVAAAVAIAGCTSSGAMRTVSESAGDVAVVRDGDALRQAMRRLWTDHVVWTRAYVVAAVANDPSAAAAAARLMKNQEDIGRGIAPYYGDAAGQKLTALLKDHINIAVELVAAAKASDNTKLADADRRWKANAGDIATFLAGANPHWPRETLRVMLEEHLRVTTEEAKARLEKRWDDDVRTFDGILDQALHMADALTDGILKQFPGRR
jgi:hypothetical protein